MILKFSQKILRLCFYSVAAVIITMAVALAVLRITLPDLGAYREDIQSFISEHMGYPVEIGGLHARWVGWIPNLDLQNIRIHDPETEQKIVKFEEAHIKFDLISSISQKTLVPSHIMINGTALTFARLEDGSIIIVESGTNLSQGNGNNQALTNWFKQQNNIIIYDADLTWLDQQNKRAPVEFKNTFIELSSDEKQIIANGTADLVQGENLANLDFNIELFGDITSNDWSGTMDFNTNQFDLGYMLNQQTSLDLDLGSQPGSGQLETRFKFAKLNQLAANIQYDELQVGKGDEAVVIDDFAIDLDMLRRDSNQWVTDIAFQNRIDENIIYKGTALRILSRYENDNAEVELALNNLPLEKIIAVSKHIPQLQDTFLTTTLADGELHKVNAVYSTLDNGSHKINLHIKAAKLDMPDYYDEPKILGNVYTDLIYDPAQNKIIIDKLETDTKDFPISINGKISTGTDNHAVLGLEINKVALSALPEYLPNTANEPLKKWINAGLLAGTGNDIKLTIDGPLNKFPFPDDEGGKARLTANVINGKINYQNNWPILDAINGSLNLAGSELKIDINNAKIKSAEVKNVKAIIPDVLEDDPNLIVAGKVTARGEMLAGFIDESPLNERRSLDIIDEINLQGPTTIKLDLNIPLYPDDLTIVNGTLNFGGNSINSEELNMQIKDLKGDINFTRDSVTAENIVGQYFDRPIQLVIPSVKEDESEYILLSGKMDQYFIKQQITHYVPNIMNEVSPYLDYINGTGSWQASYSLDPDNENEILLITSDLQGIGLQFPKPLNKQANVALPLSLEIPLSSKSDENNLRLQLENLVTANIKYTNAPENELTALSVVFGNPKTLTDVNNKITMVGDIDEFELSNWLDVVTAANEIIGESEFDPHSIFNNRYSDVNISKVHFEGYQYQDVKAIVNQTQGNWNINVNADDISGTIFIPYSSDAINFKLSKLVLKEKQSTEKADENLDPLTFPVMNAKIDQFTYHENLLGELNLIMSRVPEGLSIEQLSLNSEKVSINGQGQWLGNEKQSSTDLTFKINADTINDLITNFGFESSSIEQGKFSATLNSSWNASPFDFTLNNINGDLTLDIQKGTILDIDPKAGRLFGLLSIQTLPRRLSLDFSDLVNEGLQFDNIKGHFSVTDGQAFTNDLSMSGPSVQIAVSGRTGLVDKDYDQIVTVTPSISSTLPVAGAVFGPLGVGVGAAIYFAGEIFESIPAEIDKLLQVKYSITGSWDDPKVEKLNSTKTVANDGTNDSLSNINKAIKKQ